MIVAVCVLGDSLIVGVKPCRDGISILRSGPRVLSAVTDVAPHEVSDIRPGCSFLARDLILDGDPIRVEEQTATKTLASGEHIAAWIVEFRDHWMIAGGILPFTPELSEKLQERLHQMADDTELGLEEILDGGDPLPDDDILHEMALAVTLKMATPVFSAAWLADLQNGAANPPN